MSSSSLPSPPAEALQRLLPPEVDLADPPRHASSRPVLLGMVWSRLGRADLAWAFWDRVGTDRLRPWLAAERGRVLRELGLHAEAEHLEWPALAAAEDPVDRAMLQVSLTADAVGRGDVPTAARRLAVAEAAVADLADSPRAARQRLRLTWARTEVAWARGDRPTGDDLPCLGPDGRLDLPDDLAHGTTFHRAKALLFAGLAHHSIALLDLALADAPPVLAWAIHLARADHGAEGAEAAAADAWRAVHPPPPYADQVAATPTAQRLTSTTR